MSPDTLRQLIQQQQLPAALINATLDLNSPQSDKALCSLLKDIMEKIADDETVSLCCLAQMRETLSLALSSPPRRPLNERLYCRRVKASALFAQLVEGLDERLLTSEFSDWFAVALSGLADYEADVRGSFASALRLLISKASLGKAKSFKSSSYSNPNSLAHAILTGEAVPQLQDNAELMSALINVSSVVSMRY